MGVGLGGGCTALGVPYHPSRAPLGGWRVSGVSQAQAEPPMVVLARIATRSAQMSEKKKQNGSLWECALSRRTATFAFSDKRANHLHSMCICCKLKGAYSIACFRPPESGTLTGRESLHTRL